MNSFQEKNYRSAAGRAVSRLAVALTCSVILNLCAVGYGVYVIRGRGGWTYLKAQFNHKTPVTDTAASGRETLFRVYAHEAADSARPIVFLGDSLTAYCEWSELFGRNALILNRGIGGDTSDGVLQRIQTVTQLRPRAVFLMIGTNDPQLIRLSPEGTVSNHRKIIQQIQQHSPDTAIYIESILPSEVPGFNTWSAEVNRQLQTLADGKGVMFVNLRPSFLKDDVLNPLYTTDGLHLNAAGYQVLRDQIRNTVSGLLPEKSPATPAR